LPACLLSAPEHPEQVFAGRGDAEKARRTRHASIRLSRAPDHPSIADYGLISNCHTAALVSQGGSIDWCCLPRFDSGSCFGRLLDRRRGGCCSMTPRGRGTSSFRSYLGETLVLRTTFRTPGGEADLYDCLTIGADSGRENRGELLRVVEGTRGHVELRAVVSARFDYGAVRPWLRQHGVGTYSAIGGNDALVVSSDAELQTDGRHDLVADMAVRAQQRLRLRIAYTAPEDLELKDAGGLDPDAVDQRLERKPSSGGSNGRSGRNSTRPRAPAPSDRPWWSRR
jgi:trehalase-like protein